MNWLLGLSTTVAAILPDQRRRASCVHDHLSLLQQCIYGLALGYEDLNNHNALLHDLAIQTALDRTEDLASSSTLCRWENRTPIRIRPGGPTKSWSSSSPHRSNDHPEN